MKKQTIIISLIIIMGLGQSLRSQENLIETFNIRVGVLGAWLTYEKPLGGKFILNGEIGYVGGIIGGNFISTSTIELEPRYYYNFNKRVDNNKNVKNNSANYIALELSYFPDLLTVTKYKSTIVQQTFNIIPTFGLRRNIRDGLNYDFAIGLGYQIAEGLDDGIVPNLILGLSYTF